MGRVMNLKLPVLMLILTALFGSSLTANGQQDSSLNDEVLLFRLAEAQVDSYPATMGAIEFARLVEEKSHGRIIIEVFTKGELGGDEKAILDQVQFGAIDFTRVNISPVTELAPMLNLLQLPYLYESYDHMHKVLDSSIGQELLASVNGAMLTGLALYDAGSRNFYNNIKPVTSLEDMEGLKLRVPPSQLLIDMVNALGATAVPMAFGEVYSALQSGIIDGAENNWTSYDMVSHHEVARYITEDAHSMAPEILVASKMVMDQLTLSDQNLIKECARESVIYERALYRNIEASSRKKLIASGVIIAKQTDRDQFIEAVQPLYEKYARDYLETLDRIVAMK
ncbi:MAG: TRAP transporter substrate-binding protein [Spirochaetales bacterium]|nr:TRAP transporter substrate-binding protein [Spirochaetales bacterium]